MDLQLLVSLYQRVGASQQQKTSWKDSPLMLAKKQTFTDEPCKKKSSFAVPTTSNFYK